MTALRQSRSQEEKNDEEVEILFQFGLNDWLTIILVLIVTLAVIQRSFVRSTIVINCTATELDEYFETYYPALYKNRVLFEESIMWRNQSGNESTREIET